MVEQIVEAKMSWNKNEVKSLIEKGVKTLEKDFDERLKAVKSNLEKEIDALLEAVKAVKATEEQLVGQIKSTVKGRGFINLQTTAQKEAQDNRLKNILWSIKGNKK
jgi:translation initiation factor 2 alpha subunit (eIF-2alpha)